MEKPKLLCISALPPPYHGTSVANEILLTSPVIKNEFDLRILPVSKPKLQSGGGLSLSQVQADLSLGVSLLKTTVREKPWLTYFCLSQTPLGLWRDILWIWIASLRGSKILVHMHGGNFRHMFEKDIGEIARTIFRRSLKRLRGVIVLDECLISLFTGLVPPQNIFVLHNGVDCPYGNDAVADASRQRERRDPLRVTFLSNLIPGKGHDVFLSTAAYLKTQGQERHFRFNLAGAPPDATIADWVSNFVKTHGLENVVQVLGRVIGPEKWQLLLDSDIFVFPTTYIPEGQPFAIIEALMAGLPVISTRRGAIPGMVADGVNGYLVSGDSPAEIAEKLMVLHRNPPLRRAMGVASRKLYLEQFTAEQFVKGFCMILKSLVRSD